MRSFYADRISDNIARTPEGYIVCLGVPLARTGYQEYLGRELDLPERDRVKVYRSPEEVFSAAAIASGEGKTVTDQHPGQFVSADNEGAFHRGHAQNLRRGFAPDGVEALIGDLLIKDASLISKVLHDQFREVSVGYTAEYDAMPGTDDYAQRDIRINHIAVVRDGRAGSSFRIYDELPVLLKTPDGSNSQPIAISTTSRKERPKPMSDFVNWRKRIWGLGLKALAATDAEPEEIAEAAECTNESEDCALTMQKDSDKAVSQEENKKETQMANDTAITDDIRNALKTVADSMAANNTAIKLLLDAETRRQVRDEEAEKKAEEEEKKKEAKDAEAEEKKKEAEEKEKESEDSDLIPVATLPVSERPENPIPGADAAIQELMALKPVIAATKDAKAAERWNAAYRALKPRATGDKRYGSLVSTTKPEAVAIAEERAATASLFSTKDSKADATAYFDGVDEARKRLLDGHSSKGVN